MVELLRVDHRLLHGQVAFSWTSALGVDCILVANDDVVTNDLRKMTIKLAQPSGVKLVIKSIKDSIEAINKGVTDKYKLLIVVESIADAKALIDGCKSLKTLNLGGTKAASDKRSISKAVNVSEEETQMLKQLLADGIEIDIRMIPNDRNIDLKNVL